MGPAVAPPATMATAIALSVITVPSHTIVVGGAAAGPIQQMIDAEAAAS